MSIKTLSIIPARAGSKGLPGKNSRPFNGTPLIAHTIEQSKAAQRIDQTLVNSDCPRCLEIARDRGVACMERREEDGTDSAQVDPLLIWTVEQWEAQHGRLDVVVLLYPTAPLRPVAAIDTAVARILDEGYDSALTLGEDHTYLWQVDGDTARPTNYDPANRKPRQLENWNQWIENKAVYAMRRDLLMETGCRLGGRIGYVSMSARDSVDIDDLVDFEAAELFAARAQKGKS